MDVKTIFFNEVLEVDIYMDQSEEFIQEEKEHLVYKLQKNVVWAKAIAEDMVPLYHSFFINEGSHKSQADYSLYIKQLGEFCYDNPLCG